MLKKINNLFIIIAFLMDVNKHKNDHFEYFSLCEV